MPDKTPYTGTTKLSRIVWSAAFVLGGIYELFTLPNGHRDTLSHFVWDHIRWGWPKYVFLPFWCWITWHWLLRRTESVDYRDLVALGIGLIWALAETYYMSRR